MTDWGRSAGFGEAHMENIHEVGICVRRGHMSERSRFVAVDGLGWVGVHVKISIHYHVGRDQPFHMNISRCSKQV